MRAVSLIPVSPICSLCPIVPAPCLLTTVTSTIIGHSMIIEVCMMAGSDYEEATAVEVAVVGADDSGKAIKRALQATGA